LCVHTLALGPLLLLLSGGLERCKCQPGEVVKFRAWIAVGCNGYIGAERALQNVPL